MSATWVWAVGRRRVADSSEKYAITGTFGIFGRWAKNFAGVRQFGQSLLNWIIKCNSKKYAPTHFFYMIKSNNDTDNTLAFFSR